MITQQLPRLNNSQKKKKLSLKQNYVNFIGSFGQSFSSFSYSVKSKKKKHERARVLLLFTAFCLEYHWRYQKLKFQASSSSRLLCSLSTRYLVVPDQVTFEIRDIHHHKCLKSQEEEEAEAEETFYLERKSVNEITSSYINIGIILVVTEKISAWDRCRSL